VQERQAKGNAVSGSAASGATGRRGEEMAIEHLIGKRYRILERNYRKSFGEVDIIARDRDTLVFIEVKTRQSTRFGSPFEAVDIRKQRQISRVAQEYLQAHGATDVSARFDVIAVRVDRANRLVAIDHLQNAFEWIG
jgi:putative endonuclease